MSTKDEGERRILEHNACRAAFAGMDAKEVKGRFKPALLKILGVLTFVLSKASGMT